MYPSHSTNSDGFRQRRYSTQSVNPPHLHIPSTIHRPELFFGNGRPMTAHSTTPQTPPIPQRPHHSYSAPPPPRQIPNPYFHRSNTSPPPIPPKPLSPPALPPKLQLSTHPGKKLQERRHLDELQKAIEMSKLESDKQAALAATLSSQEEKELARALEESVRYADTMDPNSYSSALSEGSPTVYSTQAGPSNGVIDSTLPPNSTEAAEKPPALPARSVSPVHCSEDVMKLQMSDDEALARQLAAEEAEEERNREGATLKAPVTQSPQLPLYPSENRSLSSSTSLLHETNDEAYARRLAAEEEEEIMAEEAAVIAPKVSVPSNKPAVPPPPTYSDVISQPLPNTITHTTTKPSSSTDRTNFDVISRPLSSTLVHTTTRLPSSTDKTNLDVVSRPSSSTIAHTTTKSSSSTDKANVISRPLSNTTAHTTTKSPSSTNSNPSYTVLEGNPPSTTIPDTSIQVPLPPVQEPVRESDNEQPVPPPPMNNNPHIDQSLLCGVSIGFTPPSISSELRAMQGGMPNIISLPYGRCPPLHLQAPNWRHLLKLMAWLSETRMQAAVEALAVTKSDNLFLRTVIQFVRPHQLSADWRTVVWFTIDHPVPSSVPNARKYTNGDVDVLPWSYGLSSIPVLLRDGSDTPVSKTYTVPATEGIPYPPLPITFPNLAMYLNAVLETSRRYMNDSSSGVRKLAKMMDICYPTMPDPSEPDSSERGMGRLLKKVVGRNNRNRRSTRGNDDTYELVTPFVIDQY